MQVFRIEEVNKMVPLLEKIFEDIFALNTQIKMVSKDVENLVSIWGNEIYEQGNVDNKYYREKMKQRDTLMKLIAADVRRIQDMGGGVKDIDIGLVDFHYDNYGEIVLLCWKFGDKEIRYWHPMAQGYRNRRSVDELLAIRRRAP